MTRGFRSTEFWLTLAAMGLLAASAAMGWDLSVDQIVGLIGSVASYTLGRSYVKASNGE